MIEVNRADVIRAIHTMLFEIEGLNRLNLERLIGDESLKEIIRPQHELFLEVEKLFHCSGMHPSIPGDYENVSDEEFIKGIYLLLDEIHTIAFRTIKAQVAPSVYSTYGNCEAITKREVASLLRLPADACSSPIKPSPKLSSYPVQCPDAFQSSRSTGSENKKDC